MGLLNEDRMEDLANFLDGNNQAGETAVEQTEPIQAEAVQETVEAQPDVASVAEESSPSQQEHSVPYSRFKSIIDARNDLRSRNEELEAQLQSLQSQTLNEPTEQRSTEFDNTYEAWDQEYQALYGEPEQDEYSKRFQTLESRLEEFEVFQETQKLEKELAYVAERYPEVPREALLTAVVNDPTTNVLDVAERYNTFVAGVREAAIADYLKTNGVKQQEPPPAVPPRVSSAPNSQQPTGFGDQEKPRNLNEARDALFNFLQNR